MNNVFVERETFETNGKSYFTYFVRGNVRGKDVKACVVPPDLGGYAVLDIVFNGEKSAELVSTPLRNEGRSQQGYFRLHLFGTFYRRKRRSLRM